MVQALTKPVNFENFIAWYPQTGVRYELHDGVIVEMPKPTGKHSNITGFLIEELILPIIQMEKRGIWTIPRESIVKASNEKSSYEPDIIVLNQEFITAEPSWEHESIIENTQSVKALGERNFIGNPKEPTVSGDLPELTVNAVMGMTRRQ